jgi:predicted O-methyltransferase YrrM
MYNLLIMGQIVPEPIERYLAGLNQLTDPLLLEIARKGKAEGLPLIDAEVGALLRVLATAIGAKRILEVGTAVGYSGIWLAGALPPDGMLVTLELDEARAKIARGNFARAGFGSRATVVVGDAKVKSAKLSGPFDLIFQDTDKQLYVPMLDRLVSLLRPGGLLVTDNVLWDGEVAPGFTSTPKRDPADTRAIAEYNERINHHPDLMTTTVPLRDGVSISVKRGIPELKPLLDTLAKSTEALRAADFNDDASR